MLLGLEGIHDLNSSVGFRGQKEIKCVSKAHFPRHHSPDIKMVNFLLRFSKTPNENALWLGVSKGKFVF